MTLPNLSDWRVETLRVTVFGSEPIAAMGQNWWQKVTGSDPEAAINRPQAGEYSESGSFLDGIFELKAVFNRADWTLNFPFAGMPGSPEPKDLIPLLRELVPAISGWASECGVPMSRVALGVVVLKTVPSISEGNELIGSYVPFLDVSNNSAVSDLFIQLNIPFHSAVLDAVQINSVTKWAVQGRQVFSIGNSGMPTILNDVAVRSEFDLSTAVDNPVVELSVFGNVLDEMVAEVKSVLDNGLRL